MTKENLRAFVAVYLVLTREEEILLLKRCNTGYQDGNYSLVAGHLNGSETTKEGIIREAYEEAGITLLPKDIEVIHIMHRNSPGREYFDIFLTASRWTGEITNMEPNLCDELKWFSIHELPNNIIPEVKHALKNMNKKVYFGEFGWK